MRFINELMHPEAHDLFGVLNQGADNYEGLVAWKQAMHMSEEQACELYCFIDEAFQSKHINTLTKPQAVSIVSRCLWKAERVAA